MVNFRGSLQSYFDDILGNLELSAELEPNAPYTYYYLGIYYRQRGDLKKAALNL